MLNDERSRLRQKIEIQRETIAGLRIEYGIVYVEEIRTGNGGLAFVTMWKAPATTDAHPENRTPPTQTSETLRGNLPGNTYSQTDPVSTHRIGRQPPGRGSPFAGFFFFADRGRKRVDRGRGSAAQPNPPA